MENTEITNAMKRYITPDSVASSIRMERSLFQGAFLIVEGVTDAAIYDEFVDEENCHIEIAFGKENVIKVIEILNKDAFKGALAIVDADFEHIDGRTTLQQNVILTDFHDIECMIFLSPALEKILKAYGSEKKITKVEKTHGKSAREIILSVGATVGLLLKVSLEEGLCLDFGSDDEKKLDFKRFVSKDDLTFDLDKFVTMVKNQTEKPSPSNIDLIDKLSQLEKKALDLRHVARGKDLYEIIAISLRKILGTVQANQINLEVVTKSIKLAYDFRFFSETDLYLTVKEWERRNVPYLIFI